MRAYGAEEEQRSTSYAHRAFADDTGGVALTEPVRQSLVSIGKIKPVNGPHIEHASEGPPHKFGTEIQDLLP